MPNGLGKCQLVHNCVPNVNQNICFCLPKNHFVAIWFIKVLIFQSSAALMFLSLTRCYLVINAKCYRVTISVLFNSEYLAVKPKIRKILEVISIRREE